MQASPVIVGFMEITAAGTLTYLPYATGMLQTYTTAHASQPERYRFLRPHFLRTAIPEAVKALASAHVVGFSIYAWNVNYNLVAAKAIKAKNPEALIVFGGPQVPDDPTVFLQCFPFIDVVVHGEGEATFLKLLEAFPGRDWQDIPGISYLKPDKSCVTQVRGPRLKELDQIPSPYLSGLYAELMQDHPDLTWATTWETNRGCPFSCSFCDWGSAIASKVHRFGDERLQAEIRWLGEHKITSVFCADANYGILPRDLDLARGMGEVREQTGYPRMLITAMTKNHTERAFEAHKILWDAGLLRTATLSLQSVTPTVLTAIARSNISLDTYHQLLKRFVAQGIPTYTDILLGLPEETFNSFVDGLDTVITQGQHSEIRLWNVHLLPNAPMAAPDYRQKYGIESVIIPYHTPSDLSTGRLQGEIQEECEMVVATSAMNREDWRRAQALAWMVQMLYYDRLLQMPLLVIQAVSGLTHRELMLAFCEDALPPETELFGFIRQYLLSKAEAISLGEPEFDESPDPHTRQPAWLKPPHFIMSQIVISQQFGAFYSDCDKILTALLTRRELTLPPGLLTEALQVMKYQSDRRFAQKLEPIAQAPAYNLLECYEQILHGQPIKLSHQGQPWPPAALSVS